MEDIEKEKEQVSHAVETNSLIAKLMEKQNRENSRLWISQIISWVIIACLVGVICYQSANMDSIVSRAIADSQETFNQALIEAFDTIAEMEVVSDVTTTVEGDHAVYNDVAGDQFNDSAQQKNGGAD